MSYTQLVSNKATPGSLANWANDDALPNDEILVDTQQHIYSRLRTWDMLVTDLSMAFTVGSNTLPLPADFINPLAFFIAGNDKAVLIEGTPGEVIHLRRSYNADNTIQSSKPRFYYWDKTNFNFEFVADKAYPTALVYFQRPTLLGTGNQTNFITVKYPRLMRLMSRAVAFEFKKAGDPLALAELQKAEALIEELNAQSQMAIANLKMSLLQGIG
jgi:hypothetical protein